MTTFEALKKFANDVNFNGLATATRRINNNTTASIKNGVIRVTLYNTEIIGIDLNKRLLCINTGGWNTVTTRKRMNDTLTAFNINSFSVSCRAGSFQVNGSPANRYNEYNY